MLLVQQIGVAAGVMGWPHVLMSPLQPAKANLVDTVEGYAVGRHPGILGPGVDSSLNPSK